ncbi:Unknown protein, partial [Striga hermonthica]
TVGRVVEWPNISAVASGRNIAHATTMFQVMPTSFSCNFMKLCVFGACWVISYCFTLKRSREVTERPARAGSDSAARTQRQQRAGIRISSCSIISNSFNVQMAPTQATVVAQFRDYHAEKFSGQGDPRVVDEWIQGLEFIFEVMECPERYRVICAQLQFTGDARLWWNAYWGMRPGEKAGCTWEMLKDLIREKYYPTYYRAEMERQFLSLRQGTRTVDEYEREFTRLAAFVPDLVRTEAQRAQRFIDGLYPAVRHNIVGHGTQTYARVVSIAQEVDASLGREAVRGQSSSVPPMPALPSTQPPKSNKRKDKGAQTDKRARRKLQQVPQCPTCGRHHRGECRFGQDV